MTAAAESSEWRDEMTERIRIDQRSAPTNTAVPALDQADLWAWMDLAACRGLATAEFFGDRTAMAKGRARCRGCPVAEVCLWWGVVAEWDLGYRFGIWGGAGPAVRARLARATGLGYAWARFVAAAMGWRARSLSTPDTTSAA
jgi:hypothetical protein